MRKKPGTPNHLDGVPSGADCLLQAPILESMMKR
jgi:hypothetical protein